MGYAVSFVYRAEGSCKVLDDLELPGLLKDLLSKFLVVLKFLQFQVFGIGLVPFILAVIV